MIEGVIFSSETCSFGILGAQFEREVNPGELLCYRSYEGEVFTVDGSA